MVFHPYADGWQSKITLYCGTISVRYGGQGIFADKDHPYEVWYPTEDSPIGYQTADDIFEYIKAHSI